MLDTRYRVEIPGGINLETRVVGPSARCFAYAIDFFIRAAFEIVLVLVAIPFGIVGIGGGFMLIAMFVVEWLYPVLFEVLWRGQTPGKKALGIAVVNDDLTPVTLGTSMVRNLLRTVDFLPLFYLAGIVTMLSNRRFQRLGDLAAGTIVISLREVVRADLPGEIEPLPPPVPLLRNEQTSIIDFLQRSPHLSAPRREELAGILEGVTHEKGENGVERLHRIGAWFLGLR